MCTPGLARRLAVMLATAWLALSCGSARAALPAAAGEEWVEVRSARFTVYSNAGEQAATRVARHLERLAETIERTTTGFRVDGGRDIRVYVFRDRGSYVPYSPFRETEGAQTGGFHVAGNDAEYIAFWVAATRSTQGLPEYARRAATTADDLRFPSHEYLHAVVSRTFGYMPVWVNEGLAELYSTFEPRGRSAVIGEPIMGHLVTLAGHHMPLTELMAEAYDSPDYQGTEQATEHRGTLYAESWALTHMLFFDPVDHGRHFSRLLGEMAHGATGITALRTVYGPNAPDSLLNATLAYTRTTIRASEWTFATDLATVQVRTRVLGRAETEAALGELQLRSKRELAPLAREHLVAAWAVDSTRAVTAELLGELAERQDDGAEEARWFSVLDRPGVEDPRAFGLAGAALARRRLQLGGSHPWPARGADSISTHARRLLERALQAKPDEAAWLVPYAFTFLDDTTDFSAGIGALIQVRENHPNLPEIEGATAMLQMRAGNRGAALHSYGQIPRGDNHDYWRAAAGHLIAEATLAEATDLASARHLDEAESLATDLQRSVPETGVPARCARFIQWLHDPGGSLGQPPSVQSRRGGPRANAAQATPGAAGPGGPLSPPASRAAQAAEVRNRRRLQSAEAMERAGAMSEACTLYALILTDHPGPELRREVEKRRARLCR